jgi:hypothetical protein
MTTHDTIPSSRPRGATAEPERGDAGPGEAAPGAVDPYVDLLHQLHLTTRELRTTLVEARHTPVAARPAVLADLHHQIRGMATILNDAIGAPSQPTPRREAP